EVFRTIVITQNFGTRHFMLIKHTDCGGFYVKKEELIKKFKAHAKNPDAIEAIPLTVGFGELKLEEAVNRDLEILRKSPLIYPDTVISGWVFDDSTGKVCGNRHVSFCFLNKNTDYCRPKDSSGELSE
ncbi:hypothetical protein K435DRAFT_665914, partial [Dendrothele bispora CBS 962.96]